MTHRPRVVVTNWVHDDVLDFLATRFSVDANRAREPWPAAELRDRAGRAEALMAFMPDRVDAIFLAACPTLRIVACALKGYDNFDVDACTERGVWLTVVLDLLTEPTAELAVGLTIALARNMLAGDRYIRDGQFKGWRPRFYGAGLSGATVGIGLDAFLEIDTWKAYHELLSLVSVIVISRPDADGLVCDRGAKTLEDFFRAHISADFTVYGSPAGLSSQGIRGVRLFTVTALDISSSRVRELVCTGRSIRFLVPAAVQECILTRGLYS